MKGIVGCFAFFGWCKAARLLLDVVCVSQRRFGSYVQRNLEQGRFPCFRNTAETNRKTCYRIVIERKVKLLVVSFSRAVTQRTENIFGFNSPFIQCSSKFQRRFSTRCFRCYVMLMLIVKSMVISLHHIPFLGNGKANGVVMRFSNAFFYYMLFLY